MRMEEENHLKITFALFTSWNCSFRTDKLFTIYTSHVCECVLYPVTPLDIIGHVKWLRILIVINQFLKEREMYYIKLLEIRSLKLFI